MKRLLVALLTICALLVPTKAFAESEVVIFPLTYQSSNPCVVPAEPFTGTGTAHLLVSGNITPSGMAQSHLEVNLQGLKAVTLTGKKYVVVDTASDTFALDGLDAAPFEETFVITANYVRLGEDATITSGDDFYLHFRIHVTVNANGVPTVERVTIEEFCR
jgi:hypothetical protein